MTLKQPEPGLPPVVARLLAERGWRHQAVYRHGPRYWVGQITGHDPTDPAAPGILKLVLDDTRWLNPATQQERSTSDQLLAEAEILRHWSNPKRRLGEGGWPGRVAATTARWHAHGAEPVAWSVRSMLPGSSYELGASPIRFRPDFFTEARIAQLISFVRSYQHPAEQFQGDLPHLPGPDYWNPEMRLEAVSLHYPVPALADMAPAIRRFVRDEAVLYNRQPPLLSHFEVYPSHLFDTDGRLSLIDWENVGFGNSLTDFVPVWLRAFDQPDWQRAYYEQIRVAAQIGSAAEFDRLWQLETLLQACGILRYLDQSELEPAGWRAQYEAQLLQSVRSILEAGA